MDRRTHLSSSIISGDKVQKNVLGFEPANFAKVISEEAKGFVERDESKIKDRSNAFKLDSVVAEQTGVAEIKRVNRQKLVEEEALKVVKEIEEKAYDEAYKIGLEEGRKSAHESYTAEIQKHINSLHSIVNELEFQKMNLLKENEHHIVDLCFYLSKRLLMRDLGLSKETLLSVVKKLLESAQSEEEITIKIANSDVDFLKQNMNLIGKKDLISKVKIEGNEELSEGSVVLETNYGIVDASIEQRIEKLKNILDDLKPV